MWGEKGKWGRECVLKGRGRGPVILCVESFRACFGSFLAKFKTTFLDLFWCLNLTLFNLCYDPSATN